MSTNDKFLLSEYEGENINIRKEVVLYFNTLKQFKPEQVTATHNLKNVKKSKIVCQFPELTQNANPKTKKLVPLYVKKLVEKYSGYCGEFIINGATDAGEIGDFIKDEMKPFIKKAMEVVRDIKFPKDAQLTFGSAFLACKEVDTAEVIEAVFLEELQREFETAKVATTRWIQENEKDKKSFSVCSSLGQALA